MTCWRRVSPPVCALVSLAAVVLAAILLWPTPPAHPASQPAPAPVANARKPIADSQQPVAQSQQPIANSHSWGGARNSALQDGTGFFDQQRARDFAKAVEPALRKYVVELNSRFFLPLSGAEHLGEVLPEGRALASAYIQFQEHPDAAQRAELSALGVDLLSYTAGYAWIARGSPAAFAAAAKLAFVRALARIDPRDKLQARVFAGDVPVHAQAPGNRARLMLLAQPGTSAAALARELAAAEALADLAPRAARASVLGPRFEVLADVALAPRIAALDAAAYVEFAPPPAASRDAVTDRESNIGLVRDLPPNLTGSGVTVAVRELGKIDLHVDFKDRLQVVDADGDVTAFNVNHATAVTGQLGSSGVTQPQAKGAAPGVSMLAYVVGADPDTFATTDIVNAASRGVRISNHSYGPNADLGFGEYRTISADWDGALRDKGLIGMFAAYEEQAGKNYRRTDYFVGAKNTICVGATDGNANAGGPNAPKSDGIAYFSDFGPMNDGRIKPDLVAYGGPSVVLDQGTSATATNTGTSFATPAVTGVAALVFQQYKAVVGAEPSAQLTKALLCNSAADLGAPGPDAAYGFGLVDAAAAIATINLRQSSAVSPFLEGVVQNGETATFTATLKGVSAFRVTLCWMDVPGSPATAKALVNDLDAEVQGPDGVVRYPYSLDPANPSAAATATGPNKADPIEQVFVNAPVDGSWTLRVKGASVPQGPQPFALCLSQATQPPPPMGVPVILASPDTGPAPLTVSFGPLNSNPTQTCSWNYGDGAGQFLGANTEHTYQAPGSYTVTLTVKDAGGNQVSTTKVIAVTQAVVQGFPIRARARFDFSRTQNDLQFSMVVPQLVYTRQQARDAFRDGTFEGNTYDIAVNGVSLATVILDRRGAFKGSSATFKLNLVKGGITVRLKSSDLAAKLGISAATNTPTLSLPVSISGPTTAYRATFTLSYKSNGQRGTGVSR